MSWTETIHLRGKECVNQKKIQYVQKKVNWINWFYFNSDFVYVIFYKQNQQIEL